jgi:uncharacterized RmlC-like cupin family protein
VAGRWRSCRAKAYSTATFVRPGDYLFIPAGVPHVAENRTATAAVLMGARADPHANESVALRPHLGARYLGTRAPAFQSSR